jgi:DNA repair protein RadC
MEVNRFMVYQIVSERKSKNRIIAKAPKEIYHAVKRYAKSAQEQLLIVTLNTTNEIISISIASIGTINRTIVHAREVYCHAITDMAAAIVICHNHPNGALLPSDQDKSITQELFAAGKIIGIPLIDHIIFNDSSFFSFRKQKLLPNQDDD